MLKGKILTNLKAVQPGGRKLMQRSKWKPESKKIARNSGKSYVSVSKKLVEGKKFSHVTNCCVKKCCTNSL